MKKAEDASEPPYRYLRAQLKNAKAQRVQYTSQEEWFNRPPVTEDLPITLYKVWDHSISP